MPIFDHKNSKKSNTPNKITMCTFHYPCPSLAPSKGAKFTGVAEGLGGGHVRDIPQRTWKGGGSTELT